MGLCHSQNEVLKLKQNYAEKLIRQRLRDDGLITLLMKPFVSHQRAIKCCRRYIINMIDFESNLRLSAARRVGYHSTAIRRISASGQRGR